jgi:hypothetical protein
MLTEKQRFRREAVFVYGITGLFIGGLAMAIVGGLSGGTALFGVGLGICIAITVAGICVRERNIAS